MHACRRIVQVEVNTTDVSVKVTQFVKRELHSLVIYLHSSFSDQALAANIARPFAQRVRLGAPSPGPELSWPRALLAPSKLHHLRPAVYLFSCIAFHRTMSPVHAVCCAPVTAPCAACFGPFMHPAADPSAI